MKQAFAQRGFYRSIVGVNRRRAYGLPYADLIPYLLPCTAALLTTGGALLGAANSGMLTAMFALGQCLLAGAIFSVMPAHRDWYASAWPAGLPCLLQLGWATLPSCHLPPIAPPLSPDLYALSLLSLYGQVMFFLAMTRLGQQRHACRRFAEAITLLVGPGIALSMAAVRLEWVDPAVLGLEIGQRLRFSASIGNPNVAGVIFAMVSLIAMGVSFMRFRSWQIRPSDRNLLMLACCASSCLLCMALAAATQSRSAILLLLPCITLLCLGRVMISGVHRFYLLGGIALLVVLALSIGFFFDRLEDLPHDGATRLAIWARFWTMAQAAPWSGYGPGSFIEINQHTLTVGNALTMWDFGAAHAAPLQVVLELGWPGLALVLAWLGAVFWRLLRHGSVLKSPVALSMVLAVLLPLCASLFDIAMNVPAVVGLVMGLSGLLYGRASPPSIR
ncbi:O-antigen ligase family protein [Novosphingobium terrae]|uniref:O-antigen ligase family protein n=1 Tax=Novosphingobium terrae TaxID=2726189 RepID=UPI00197FB31E|nr:O-antigen ligase family protein [Novosphingobium terrae]